MRSPRSEGQAPSDAMSGSFAYSPYDQGHMFADVCQQLGRRRAQDPYPAAEGRTLLRPQQGELWTIIRITVAQPDTDMGAAIHRDELRRRPSQVAARFCELDEPVRGNKSFAEFLIDGGEPRFPNTGRKLRCRVRCSFFRVARSGYVGGPPEQNGQE